MNETKLKPWNRSLFHIAIILLIAYFQLFHKLDYLPIRVWDEGKNAVSAYEMLQNKHYLVRFYEGEPDETGFKPPLLTWHQVFFMKLIGINELSVRLPSALYALLTALLLYYFATRELNLPVVGIIAVLVLLTSYGYLDRHVARTGDHDSMVVFFLTVQAIYFYKYLKYKDRRNRYLAIITLALVFGTLTKSIVGLSFIPGFILYAAIHRRLKYILLHRQLYWSMLCYVLIISCYYVYRELNSPGYISAVWNHELLPRYTNSEGGYIHLHDYFFYLRNFWDKRLVPWIYLLPFIIGSLFFIKDKDLKAAFKYLLLLGVTYLVIFSLGTKQIWYDAPLYPILAIITAMGIYQWFRYVLQLPVSRYIRWGIVAIAGVALIYYPLKSTKELTFEVQEKYWVYEEEGINYVLREHLRQKQNIRNLGIAYSGYHSHIRFYMNLLNDSGSSLYFTDYEKLKPGSRVIACESLVKEYIEQNYECTIVSEQHHASIYQIGTSVK